MSLLHIHKKTNRDTGLRPVRNSLKIDTALPLHDARTGRRPVSRWRVLGRSHLFALGILAFASAAHACGPDFPNQVIVGGSESLLRIPSGNFAIELASLKSAAQSPFKAGPYDSAKVDTEELAAALAKDGKSNDALMKQYAQVRKLIADHAIALEKRVEEPELPRPLPMENVAVPGGLPIEFELYIRGLIAFHRDDAAAAQKCWKDLLALPVDQRSHRSTWAAFMLGKSFMPTDSAQSTDYFKLTRKLSTDGFADSLGLASSSLGWQAKVNLDKGLINQAMGLYIQQWWTGDAGAEASLRECAAKVLSGSRAMLIDAAGDPESRQVVTAFLISNDYPRLVVSKKEQLQIPAWLSAVESAAVKDMPGADRFAWLAYDSGDFAQAQRWIARSPQDSVVANWVRAKLLLRDGKTDEAAKILVKVVRAFPQSEFIHEDYPDGSQDASTLPQSITTDLGVLQLARGQYTDSMRLLMVSDHWQDAAYIAERVLTSDELKTFVDRYCPAPPARAAGAKSTAWDATSANLRLLLARRLTRDGNWKVARDYFTADLQSKLDDYIYGIRLGHDKTKSDAIRAAAYLSAARIAHANGMELLGTELSPDFAIYDGSYTGPEDIARLKEKGLAAPTEDELARHKANAPDDNRRFHYRYIAAEHAWNAAELLPDDDEQTAKVLYESGCWLKDRDPKAADKFYKALVRRCPDTDLGKAAAEAHWFPKVQAATVKE